MTRASGYVEEKESGPVLSSRRREIYDYVVAHPGSAISDLVRRLSMNWTLVRFHVVRLESLGLVQSLRVGRRRLLFATPLADPASSARYGLLAEPACLEVAKCIIAHPGQRVADYVELTAMSERAVYHHVRRLAEAGLVASKKRRLYEALSPTPELCALFASRR